MALLGPASHHSPPISLDSVTLFLPDRPLMLDTNLLPTLLRIRTCHEHSSSFSVHGSDCIGCWVVPFLLAGATRLVSVSGVSLRRPGHQHLNSRLTLDLDQLPTCVCALPQTNSSTRLPSASYFLSALRLCPPLRQCPSCSLAGGGRRGQGWMARLTLDERCPLTHDWQAYLIPSIRTIIDRKW